MNFTDYLHRFGKWLCGYPRSRSCKKLFQRRLELEGLEERALLSANLSLTGVLTVNGDDFGVSDDTIVLRTDPGNANVFQVLLNGQTQFNRFASDVRQIVVNSGGGSD